MLASASAGLAYGLASIEKTTLASRLGLLDGGVELMQGAVAGAQTTNAPTNLILFSLALLLIVGAVFYHEYFAKS
ncbi:hypothetical protein HYS29_00125 [Candidatus Microgenomates bacterium]|nr:hypothetical protein [Candidatus Microgenomates bacterium]